jgi:hypothetical protein
LVGVWVHSPEKVGKDAGELGGIAPLGVAATNDADALLALRPDCVIYAAHRPERDAAAIPDYVRILEAGVNLVTVSTRGSSTRRTTTPGSSRSSAPRRNAAA